VLKYQNKNGEGGFINGLTPQYAVAEESVALQPIGSKTDPLLGTALGIIDPGMQARLDMQMSIRRSRSGNRFKELPGGGPDMSDSRPLDVTELLKGEKPALR